MRRPIAIWVLASTWISFSSPGATPASHTKSVSVGISRLGNLSGEGERAYPILENQVRRWLENTESAVRFLPTRARVSKKDSDHILRMRLEDLARDLRRHTYQGEAALAAQSVGELKEALQSLERDLSAGPWIQEGYLALAAHEWRANRKKSARESLVRAQSVHPEGKIEIKSLWPDGSEAYDWTGFEEEIRGMVTRRRTLCQVTLNSPPAELMVNGFPLSQPSVLALGAGHFELASHTSDTVNEAKFRCKKQGRYELSLAPSRNLLQGALSSVDVGTHFLIEPRGDEFRFYLFTPGVGLDEIPVSQPVKISGVLAQSSVGEAALPFSTDAFLELFNRHQDGADSTLALNVDAGTGSVDADLIPSLSEQTEVPWVKQWEFWAVVGAIGVTALVIGLSNQGDVAGNPANGVRLNFE